MSIRQVHTCTSIAEGCKKSTMSTYKTKKNGKRVGCGACAANVTAGKPQHE